MCEGVRWKVLFDLAERHGVHPLLYRAFSGEQDWVPAAEMRVQSQLYQANLHKAMLIARELIHLVDHLAGTGIEVLPYKGVALAQLMYGDIALRQTGDIDLLIRARDLPRIRNAVRDLGYVPQLSLSPAQERAYLKSGYECVFDGPAGRNLLEVQWGILPRFYAVDFEPEDLFRRTVPLQVAGHAMKSPSMEDLFLILSLHAAKHVWERLIWLCDLAWIARLPQLNWPWIAAQAINLGTIRILRVTLLLIKHLLKLDIPVAAESGLPPDPQTDLLAHEITAHIVSATEYNVESLAYFQLMLRLRENSRDRIRFISRLVLTPGPGEWAAVRLPGRLFPLYRLVRLGRLAGKFLRR